MFTSYLMSYLEKDILPSNEWKKSQSYTDEGIKHKSLILAQDERWRRA